MPSPSTCIAGSLTVIRGRVSGFDTVGAGAFPFLGWMYREGAYALKNELSL